MNDESYLDKRIRQRNEMHQSLAEQMLASVAGNETADNQQELVKGDKPSPLPSCGVCNGKGKVQGLFSKSDCFACDGTGYDLSNPIAIIHHQKHLLEWAKVEVQKARNELSRALDTRTDAEKLEEEVNDFYKGSKYRRFD